MKVAINVCYGGFSLSEEAVLLLKKLKKDKLSEDEMKELGEFYYTPRSNRTDADLIRVIEELGEGASGGLARLKVVEVPDDVAWKIQECDGSEWIAELHRTWR